MSDAAAEMNTPVAQSLRIGFGGLYVAMLALGAWWATSNIRTVPPDSQAVMVRFGAVVGTRASGLVLAWPRPFEDVVLVPAAQRQIALPIDAATPLTAATVDPVSRFGQEVPPASAGLDLTGDGGAILLDSTLFFRVDDPRAFYLSDTHVAPALRRLYLAAAAATAARSDLNDLVVVAAANGTPASQARREALRGALVDETNARLQALAASGASLGVVVTRVDVAAFLPPAAKNAFDSVLEASQMAEQGLAAARTDAARVDQNAHQEADRLLAAARASAGERLSQANAQAATVTAAAADTTNRVSFVDQLYRERIAAILHAAGSVGTVDRRTDHLILPGNPP